jgi:hypothetical protein
LTRPLPFEPFFFPLPLQFQSLALSSGKGQARLRARVRVILAVKLIDDRGDELMVVKDLKE